MGSAVAGSAESGRRCAKHGLAAAPDGLCALCRSESRPPPRDYSKWVLGGMLSAVLMVSVGTLAYRTATSWRPTVTLPEERTTPKAASASTPEPEAETPPEEELREAATGAHEGESIPLTEPLPTAGSLALEATPPGPTPPTAAASPSAAASPTTAPSPRAPPTQAELRAALTATPITMYSASWCGVCRRARQFMNENGLRYQEIDADRAPGGWDKVAQLSGERAVPLIIVDGELIDGGLSPRRVMAAVARSMERRLGVTGIRFK